MKLYYCRAEITLSDGRSWVTFYSQSRECQFRFEVPILRLPDSGFLTSIVRVTKIAHTKIDLKRFDVSIF